MTGKKHSTYYEVREALEAPGCPICRLAARSVRRHLEILSFESVNDISVRTRLRAARGFCGLHAWQLLDDIRDPFGAGIIYRDVLKECARLLARGAVADLVATGSCPTCDVRAESTRRHVDVLLEHLTDGDLERRLADRGGLCWRHFALGLGRGGRGLRALAQAQIAALERGGANSAGSRPVSASPTSVRAGNAAPRPTIEDEIGDPLVALAVGLRGVHGVAIDTLEARAWGEPEPAPSVDPEDVTRTRHGGLSRSRLADASCPLCTAATRAVEVATRVPPPGPLELCPPHAWQVLDTAGAEVTHDRLRPALELFRERLVAADARLATTAPLGLGPFSLELPAARRRRGDLALELGPGRGCAICQAQVAAEAEALRGVPTAPLCRPHLLAATPQTVGVGPATLAAWTGLVAELEEFIRKNDYRFRDELRGAEQSSPRRAIAMVAGGQGVR